MGRLKSKIDYENLRHARILENQARLASLGLQRTISDLRALASTPKPEKTQKRKWTKRVSETTSLRRSDRLKQISTFVSTPKLASLRRSYRLRGKIAEPISSEEVESDNENEEENKEGVEMGEKMPANWPFMKMKGVKLQNSPEVSARRCQSGGRNTVYDSIIGICCHFCRQKTLCSEEDCRRCGNLDPDQPCIGKTDCSVCHSTNGVFCRACLKIRYGEEIEEVRENKEWMCPHCIEERGTNPYWICNSSFCLKRRKIAPTGILIYKAREMGYKSVAHFLMDELQKRQKLT